MYDSSKLVLHCGAYGVSLDEVARAPTPARTDSHVPIPHINFVELLFDSAQRLGITLKSQEHALAKDGARYFGLFHTDDLLPGVGTLIGLRNSHDMAYTASVVLGTHVFVCDNLSFNGEVKLSRKHTSHVERDLPGIVMRGVEQLVEMKAPMADRIERYQAAGLPEPEADHAICTLVRGRGLMPSQVANVIREFDKPSHLEHLDPAGERTVWTLFNAVTAANKGTSIFPQPKRCEVLQSVCDSMVRYRSPIAKAAEGLDLGVA